ncbi:hypothetical protein Y1Q_0011335 [Alligator mississippiensis]|uniref:Uncharacterized protein n=1 Tax=Alligator mississippiensis TaxID=8496 RepID=A0A151N8C3_ALLMI|nr:hypothetical protein Y1Q_0011335 [Alligator mississippiensis]
MEDVAHEAARDRCEEERDWHEEERDQVDQEFRDRLLVLERHVETLEQQDVLVARTVEMMEKDCWVIDTVLALVVAFMPPTALSPAAALPAPWQLPTPQQ